MTNQVHLYVIEANPERAKSLRTEQAGLPQVTVLQKYTDAEAASGGLDAVFVPLMSAMEWGAIKPPAPLHRNSPRGKSFFAQRRTHAIESNHHVARQRCKLV
jgi:hypothetical protein